jgi:hypothetical protein
MSLVQTGERARIVPGVETLGDDLVLRWPDAYSALMAAG